MAAAALSASRGVRKSGQSIHSADHSGSHRSGFPEIQPELGQRARGQRFAPPAPAHGRAVGQHDRADESGHDASLPHHNPPPLRESPRLPARVVTFCWRERRQAASRSRRTETPSPSSSASATGRPAIASASASPGPATSAPSPDRQSRSVACRRSPARRPTGTKPSLAVGEARKSSTIRQSSGGSRGRQPERARGVTQVDAAVGHRTQRAHPGRPDSRVRLVPQRPDDLLRRPLGELPADHVDGPVRRPARPHQGEQEPRNAGLSSA